jgi:hypothetical protein
MDEAKFAKWGLLAGAVFVVLSVVAAFIAGTPPKLSDADGTIVKYFQDNQDALKIGSYLNGLGGLFFLWFLGSLFGRLRRAEGGAGRLSGVALTGAVVALATVYVAGGISAFSAIHPTTAPGDFRLSTLLFGYAAFPLAVFTAAVSVVLWSQNVLPKWMGYAGEGIAVLWLVGAASVSTENDTIGVIGLIAFLAWGVWILLLSVLLYRTPEAA